MEITSIDIEVSVSTPILFQFGIDIDDTFIASIDIEYRQYFWDVSLTTPVVSSATKAIYNNKVKENDLR